MHQIQLANVEFEGRNSVYLLGADDPDTPTTLVDTGVATDAARTSLRTALADHGVSFADLDQVLLTHWHYDHTGLAGEIQAASDAAVYVHEADAPIVEQDADALAALEARQRTLLDEWGMPEEKQAELLDFLDHHDEIRGEPVEATTVTDGDVIAVGDLDLTVVHLPGHAEGLVGYVCERGDEDGDEGGDGVVDPGEGRREGFLGDAILPKYTPNVGGADVRVERPLAKYLASLDRIVELELDRVWPGHRGPIFAPAERARDIARHHDERTERVRDVLREQGPATAWEVSAALFGDLHGIHVLHGPGEAYAHLDHLVHEGEVVREDGRYALAGDVGVGR